MDEQQFLRQIHQTLINNPGLSGAVESIACSVQGKGWTGGNNGYELACALKVLGEKKVNMVIDCGGHHGNYSFEVRRCSNTCL